LTRNSEKADNEAQGEIQRERLSEEAPKEWDGAIVRTWAITK